MTLPNACPKPERTPPKVRRSLPKAKKRPAAVNKKRKAFNLERAHGPAERRAWTKQQPCMICGRTPSDAAHMRSGGTSRKSSVKHTAPLCSSDVRTGYVGHHDEFDAGKQTFAAKYGFDRDQAERLTEARWVLHCAAIGVEP